MKDNEYSQRHHLSGIRAVEDRVRSSNGFELFDSSLLSDDYSISVPQSVFELFSISGAIFST
jgi:hypothetical protein